MSPIHATFIAIRTFVLDPEKGLQVFFSMLIALAIFAALVFLYYLFMAKFFK
jgi:hypothetical protein